MFTVSDADAAAIRSAWLERGELAGAIELRRLYPGVAAAAAREWARTIAGWTPAPIAGTAKPPKRARP